MSDLRESIIAWLNSPAGPTGEYFIILTLALTAILSIYGVVIFILIKCGKL